MFPEKNLPLPPDELASTTDVLREANDGALDDYDLRLGTPRESVLKRIKQLTLPDLLMGANEEFSTIGHLKPEYAEVLETIQAAMEEVLEISFVERTSEVRVDQLLRAYEVAINRVYKMGTGREILKVGYKGFSHELRLGMFRFFDFFDAPISQDIIEQMERSNDAKQMEAAKEYRARNIRWVEGIAD